MTMDKWVSCKHCGTKVTPSMSHCCLGQIGKTPTRKPGRPTGYRAADPRNVRKQIRWTAAEWAEIEKRAALVNMNAVDYQRARILRPGA